MSEEKIYLGLDIGTDSIGYAVTDQNYQLKKHGGNPMWGVTLFEAANLNAERRAFRSARRRLDRRQQRVLLLQELFAPEISKIDKKFFIRLKESALYRDEAESKYSIFDDIDYSDIEFHKQYPTIHHLIDDMMYSDNKHDIRLVYLACAWLVAHRGHFLNEVSKDNIAALTDFSKVVDGFMLYFADNEYVTPWSREKNGEVEKVLKKKLSITAKYKELVSVLFDGAKVSKNVSNDFPFNKEVMLKALCGSRISAKDLFVNEEYADVKSFSLGDDDASIAEVIGSLNDDADLILRMKEIYDWSILVDSLSGKETISKAKIAVYEQHNKDLAFLKSFIRNHSKESYNLIFRDSSEKNPLSYSLYIASTKHNDNFTEALAKLVGKIQPDATEKSNYDDMIARLELKQFLPKQKSTNNRVIPHQLYWYELDMILKNASIHYSFLSDLDEGISTADKIRSIFTFKVPYFIGPLNSYSKEHSWIVKKCDGKIYPWNFEKMVDFDRSEQEFINRMTNHCTYLPGENVIPKESLLYHKYSVLNEINNIRIDNVKISVQLKQKIYTNLFKSHKKVTRKKLEDYLKSNNYLSESQTLSGIDIQINSNLKPYFDFKKLLDDGVLNEEQVERIIERITYSEERSRAKNWIKSEFPNLSEDDIGYISKLNYKDFGRLSKRFLSSFDGVNKETGEVTTIISELWNTNNNLMEILSDKYTFAENAENERMLYYTDNRQSLSDRLDDMYISNAIKRPIIRTMDIVNDVVKASGKAPDKIFVEMARGAADNQKNKRTVTRKQQLIELYKKIKTEEVRLLQKQLEDMGDMADNNLQSDRLFLYFMQLGKCVYSGQSIDITQIKGETYNIEHIYPQALVKDDSILNNEVLVLSKINGYKSDTYPVPSEIRCKMAGFWLMLKENGLITEEKYKRLTRKEPFSADEKLGFINRQLTETTQSTKAVATLLKEKYPETEIVYVKARLASEFRQEFGMLKSRTFNDLHHAKDAYLNIVVGNVYNMRFTKRWFDVNSQYSVKTKTLFKNELICGNERVWGGENMIGEVKNIISKNNARITRYSFCRHGGFFDQMPLKAAKGLIPRKKDLPTEKYGGYNKATVSFFLLVKYRVGKKSELMVMPVELLYADKAVLDMKCAEEYAKDRIGRITGKSIDSVSFPIGLRKLKVNTMLSLDGFRICIAGTSGGGRCIIAQPYMQFSADLDTQLYVKRLESFTEKLKNNANLVYNENYDKISSEQNIKLYDMYIKKLKDSVYKKRPNNPIAILESGREKFIDLDVKTQAVALLSIHQVFGRVSGGCDLTYIGGAGKAAATVSFSTSVSNWKKQYSDVRIIDQSASGIWEKVSDFNLIDLV